MKKRSIKNTRINEEVHRELSNIIRGEIKDPRVSSLCSVVGVEEAPDLKTAKAYISVLGDEKAQADTMEACAVLRAISANSWHPISICAIHRRFSLFWISRLNMASECQR